MVSGHWRAAQELYVERTSGSEESVGGNCTNCVKSVCEVVFG